MTTKIPDPIKIHPFIKFCRYSFLTAGIIYGAARKKTLQIKEAGRAEEKHRRRIERTKRLEQEKELAKERDLLEFIAIFTNKSVSKLMGHKVETQYVEQSTQTLNSDEIMQNDSINFDKMGIKEAVKNCDPAISEIYDNDDKGYSSNAVVNSEADSAQIEECDKSSENISENPKPES